MRDPDDEFLEIWLKILMSNGLLSSVLLPRILPSSLNLLLGWAECFELHLRCGGTLAMAEEDDDAAAPTSSTASQFDDDSDGLPRLLSLNHNSRRSSQPHYDPDDDPSTSSPPASPSSANPNKERGRLRIHNVGGSLTFLLQVLSLSLSLSPTRQLHAIVSSPSQTSRSRLSFASSQPLSIRECRLVALCIRVSGYVLCLRWEFCAFGAIVSLGLRSPNGDPKERLCFNMTWD